MSLRKVCLLDLCIFGHRSSPGAHTKLRCRDLTSMGVDGQGPTYPTRASNSRCRLPCCEAIWAISEESSCGCLHMCVFF